MHFLKQQLFVLRIFTHMMSIMNIVFLKAKKGLPNTEVSDSPNWLLQDAESPCRHDLISRLTWITFGVPSLHFLISAQSP